MAASTISRITNFGNNVFAPPAPKIDTPPADPHRTIAVLRMEPAQDDVIALVDIKVGGLIIRKIQVRRGRGHSTYINFPSTRDNETGQWASLVEFSSQQLEAAVRQVILQAVSNGKAVR